MGTRSEEEERRDKWWGEDLQRTVIQSKDSAINSARSFHLHSSSLLSSLQDKLPLAISHFNSYEHAFFSKLKEELTIAREHPSAAVGFTLAASFLLFRGPRRFLFRHTLGRFQSEEAQFLRAEKNVKDFNLSVELVKKESRKLVERAALAEKDMKHGQQELMDAGSHIHRLAKSVYKVETKAVDLMDELREIPGREALKLRAEVASMASVLKQQRMALYKRILKISELGVPV
ncbi:hypothetical protein K2173_014503 [Erythroxylum novogranatense]|uniref:Uncharacterized protein n=1 Tax=Erythroxylum novogranatense TaxID=1862640 RepID=A0AAV8S6Q1_9ROSI|nr:hypothetical protein K2173_014503 [Erythroxylum novogranatense]